MTDWHIIPSDKDLMHYGILGMKWGVRRYQNKDGSLTADGKERYDFLKNQALQKYGNQFNKTNQVVKLKKGQILKRVTVKTEPIDERPKYVSFTKRDNDTYAEMADYLGGHDDIQNRVQISYELKRDIKIASYEEVRDYILKLYKDEKVGNLKVPKGDNIKYAKLKQILYEDIKDMKISDFYNSEKDYMNIRGSVVRGKKLVDDLLEERSSVLITSFTDIMSKALYKERNTTYNYFKNKGYDAITDVEDAGGGIYGFDQPLIILNPKQVLKYKSEVKV